MPTRNSSAVAMREAANSAAVAIRARGVVTQETTPGDSSGLLGRQVNKTAVAIRKARRLANDWRKPLHGNGCRIWEALR